ncbi:MAG: alpha-glucan family phosphorylase [Acidimicrobiales bacterium]|jgi:starch phosphorylase
MATRRCEIRARPPVLKRSRHQGVGFEDLLDVATNLRWTWQARTRALFARLDPTAGPSALEWPCRLLLGLGRAAVEERLASDPDLAKLAAAVVADTKSYKASRAKTWFPQTHRKDRRFEVAYFAAEFALTDSLPVYAGGLGAVAGEFLKSASALGVPLVGVGLLYRETSHQWVDDSGLQQESWEVLTFERLPIELARDAKDRPARVKVPLPGRDVVAQIWTVLVGRNRLYLLDTNLRRNQRADRAITGRLYGGDEETRIQQELVLGVGGIRALAVLGHEPEMVHLNEGHSAFAALERVRQLMVRDRLSFAEARLAAAPGLLFTTHTPVAAGHDYFPAELANRYLRPYASLIGVDPETLSSLGRYRPDDRLDSFCPTVFALRLAGARNGVSRLHGAVTREQWGGLWPRLPLNEVPIGHVTNGIHLSSWISPEIEKLLDFQLGPEWKTTPGSPASWKPLVGSEDEKLWDARCRARARLIEFTRVHRNEQLARRGTDAARLAATDALLDAEALTIGFVGRFVAYKRPTLFLRDPDRLAGILDDPDRPVQIIFAGKAHPRDEFGKQLLRDVVEFARLRRLQHRVVFIEDFDITADRALAQGVDLWLNTPRRPLEACGIGGMKAGVNGSLNLSTLDGWWDEVWNDADPAAAPFGWCIGTGQRYEDFDAQDASDAESLYDALEHKIVPTFYDRDAQGVPRAWLASVRQSMASLAPTWHSHRMVHDYVEYFYLPGAHRGQWLSAEGAARARQLCSALERLRDGWPAIRVAVETATVAADGTQVEIMAELGPLEPYDVTVQLWVAPTLGEAYPLDTDYEGRRDNISRYGVRVPHEAGNDAELVARVLPCHPLLADPYVPGLITWSD